MLQIVERTGDSIVTPRGIRHIYVSSRYFLESHSFDSRWCTPARTRTG
jgi:hypothetical protein